MKHSNNLEISLLINKMFIGRKTLSELLIYNYIIHKDVHLILRNSLLLVCMKRNKS